MRKTAYPDSDLEQTRSDTHVSVEASPVDRGLPNRLMTAFEVAAFVGCHEETIRRAYLRGLLTSQRFGVRGRRFHPADVVDWIRRGAPTRPSCMRLTE
jgi:excisionase family DNA binding protein